MSLVRVVAAAAVAVSVALPAAAQGIPKAQSPEEVGFSATRLKRLSERIEEEIKNNELPGAVVLIGRYEIENCIAGIFRAGKLESVTAVATR